jgi:hypothetical protein
MYLLIVLLGCVFTLITILLCKIKNSVHQVLIFGLYAIIMFSFYIVLDNEKKKIKL